MGGGNIAPKRERERERTPLVMCVGGQKSAAAEPGRRKRVSSLQGRKGGGGRGGKLPGLLTTPQLAPPSYWVVGWNVEARTVALQSP